MFWYLFEIRSIFLLPALSFLILQVQSMQKDFLTLCLDLVNGTLLQTEERKE